MPGREAQTRGRSVLVLNGTQHFEIFHEFLIHTLRLMKLNVTTAASWKDARRNFFSSPASYNALLIDPRVDDFREEELATYLRGRATAPSLIGIQLHSKDEDFTLGDEVRIHGLISKTQSPEEMAFVFHRVLFTSGANQRKFPRALASVVVDLGESGQWNLHRRATFNISTGGIFLRSRKNGLGEGSLRLSIDLPDGGKPISCMGRTAYHQFGRRCINRLLPEGLGVQITEIDEGNHRRLAVFTKEHLLPVDRTLDSEKSSGGTPATSGKGRAVSLSGH
ncbi:MAG TPA: PilZ domain-containing protein [Bdellovibrionota bacterium]|nr:PilZ domain-containing protein [Bdellovibrionota bacterium]